MPGAPGAQPHVYKWCLRAQRPKPQLLALTFKTFVRGPQCPTQSHFPESPTQ